MCAWTDSTETVSSHWKVPDSFLANLLSYGSFVYLTTLMVFYIELAVNSCLETTIILLPYWHASIQSLLFFYKTLIFKISKNLLHTLKLSLTSLEIFHKSKSKLHFPDQKRLKFLWSKFSICTEAVVQRCSVKKVFLEISQNSQKKNCVLGLQLY